MKSWLLALVVSLACPALAQAQTANLWVDTDGGTCTRTGGAGATYSSAAACSSMAAAGTAATSGDTIRMKAGTYGGQSTIGGSGKTLTYIGEGPTLTVIDSGSANGSTGSPSAYNTMVFRSNTTVEGIGVTGDYPIVGIFGGTSNIVWRDFSLTGRETRTCSPGSDEPLIIQADTDGSDPITNILIEDGVFGAFTASRDGQGGCSGDTFHLEKVRIGRDVDGVTFRNVDFGDCPPTGSVDGCNTATVFLTTPNSSALKPRNIRFVNNRFGNTHGSQPNIHVHGNVTTCSGYLVAYNTFDGAADPFYFGEGCTSSNDTIVVGNLGSRPQTNCSTATFLKNVWQWASGTACGTDTRVSGSSSSVSALGINATTHKLESGSVAIDAGETPGASDHCTGSHVNSLDVDGGTRPNGSVCDAGWDEFGADGEDPPPASGPVRIRFRIALLFLPFAFGGVYATRARR